MSKDFVQIANDVATGVGLLRQGVPEATKAFPHWQSPLPRRTPSIPRPRS